MLRDHNIGGAIAAMSQHPRDDYPPAWDPPPRIGWPEPEQPAVMDVMKVLAREPAAPWVRAVYIDKFERRWLGWGVGNAESLREVMTLLHALPEGPALMKKHEHVIADFPPPTQPVTTRPGAP
jgi:hypothetical protein